MGEDSKARFFDDVTAKTFRTDGEEGGCVYNNVSTTSAPGWVEGSTTA